MKILLARIDDRFIHGQVTVGWSQKLSPDHILLSNNEIAADPWQVRVYRSAVPPGMRVSILSTSQTVAVLKSEDGSRFRDERCILLVGNPADMLFVQRHGPPMAEINVGGMHYVEGKKQLLPFVYVDSRDLAVFHTLLDQGCRLVAQQLPGSKETHLDHSLLRSAEELF